MKITKIARAKKKQCRELYNEEKDKKKEEYGKCWYQNMSEGDKQRLKESSKNYRKTKKSTWKNMFYFSLHCVK